MSSLHLFFQCPPGRRCHSHFPKEETKVPKESSAQGSQVRGRVKRAKPQSHVFHELPPSLLTQAPQCKSQIDSCSGQ